MENEKKALTKTNKITWYYFIGALCLFLFLKVTSSGMFKGVVDFSVSFLPFVIILALVIRGYFEYIKFKKDHKITYQDPQARIYATTIRKRYLKTILELLFISLLFYVFYSPQSFVTYLVIFSALGRLVSLETYSVLVTYFSIAIVAGTIIFIALAYYLKSQKIYEGDLKKVTRNSLYTLFFIFFIFFSSTALAYPGAYSPVVDYLAKVFFNISKKNNPASQGEIHSLDKVVARTYHNLKDNFNQSNQDLAANLKDIKDTINSVIIQTTRNTQVARDTQLSLSKDIKNKLNIKGGNIRGDLKIIGNLEVRDIAYFKNILPNRDNSYDLGSSSDSWKSLYVSRLAGPSAIIIGGASSSHGLNSAGDLMVSSNLEVKGLVYFDDQLILNNQKITSLADPTNNTDAATKQYVDNQVGGNSFLQRTGTVISPINYGDSLDMTGGDIINIGSVGIGTTNPTAKLQIKGNGTSTGVNFQTIDSSNNALVTMLDNGNVGIGTTPLSRLTVSGGASIGADYNTASPANGLLVEGNVGIGTISPIAKLSVAGDGYFDGILTSANSIKSPYFIATDSLSTSTFKNIEGNGKVFYDSLGGYYDFGSRYQFVDSNLNPNGIYHSVLIHTTGLGDNTTYKGVTGLRVFVRDDSSVTTSTKGVLYAIHAAVEPKIDRDNVPYDDVDGIAISNEGDYKGTDALYLSTRYLGKSEWSTDITLDAWADYGINFGGTFASYGIDMVGAGGTGTYSSGKAIRIPNNVSIVAQNYAKTSDISLLKLDTSDSIDIGDKIYVASTGNVGIGTNVPAQKLDVVGFINTDQYSGYKQAGNTILYASSTLSSIYVGQNAGSMSSTGNYNSFIGTNVGYSNTTGNANVFVGTNAGASNTTGSNNSFIGRSAGLYNTTGSNNSFVGFKTGVSNTTGTYNSLMGTYAGSANTTGIQNSFIGSYSGSSNTTGSNNSFIGLGAGYANTTGSNNSALGQSAGRYIADGATANATGSNNTFLGYNTKALADGDINETVLGYNATGIGSNSVVLGNDSVLKTILKGNVGLGTASPAQKLDVVGFINTDQYSGYKQAGNTILYASSTNFSLLAGVGAGNSMLSDGLYNTALGYQALYTATSTDYNTAVGYHAGYSNTTGYANSFMGYNAGYSNTTGNNNSFVGTYTGASNTTGYSNSFIGRSAGFYNTTGSNNSALGYNAGRYIADGTTANATGSYNVFIGNSTKALADGDTNETVLGYNAIGAGSNSVVLGNDSVTKHC